MTDLQGVIFTLLYFAAGVFLNYLIDDDLNAPIVIFWPIIAGFTIGFIVIYVIPHGLAEGIKAGWREYKKNK